MYTSGFEQDEMAALNGSGGSSTGSNLVYIGPVKKTTKVSRLSPHPVAGTYLNVNKPNLVDETKSAADMVSEFYTWDEKTYNNFVSRLRSQGYISKGEKVSPPKVQAIWEAAVYGAAKWYSASGFQSKITVDQYLDWYSRGETATGPSTSKSVTIYSPEQIRSWLDEGLQSKFGRTVESLTADELNILQSEIANYTKKASVTKTTTDASGVTTTTNMPGATTAGVEELIAKKGKGMFAEDFERQQRITFADWLSKNVAGA